MSFLPTVLIDDPNGSRVVYHPGFIPPDEADALLTWMRDRLPWQAETYNFGGQPVTTRRKSCAVGDPGITYRYSGVTRSTQPWPPAVKGILNRVMIDTGTAFNFALANLYPDGKAAIGAHADDEPEIEPDSLIACVSFGAARDFVLHDKTGQRAAEVNLENGSLLIMAGTTQRHFKHALPARKKVVTPRVSLTFRRML